MWRTREGLVVNGVEVLRGALEGQSAQLRVEGAVARAPGVAPRDVGDRQLWRAFDEQSEEAVVGAVESEHTRTSRSVPLPELLIISTPRAPTDCEAARAAAASGNPHNYRPEDFILTPNISHPLRSAYICTSRRMRAVPAMHPLSSSAFLSRNSGFHLASAFAHENCFATRDPPPLLKKITAPPQELPQCCHCAARIY